MQCEFIKENGQKCEANALKGDNLCFYHSNDPEIIKIREEAVVRGGKNSRSRYEPIIDEIEIKNTQSIVELITKIIEEVRQDKITSKKANTIGYLLNVAIRALQQSEVEERLKKIEDVLSNREQEN